MIGRVFSGFRSFVGGGVKGFASGPGKLAKFVAGRYKPGFSDIAKVLETGKLDRVGMKTLARASMRTLGTTAALTYGYRTLRTAAGGPGIFKNRKGKRDIVPFVPFV